MMSRKSFVRERTVSAGPLKAVSIYTRTFEQESKCKEPRGRKKTVSRISQENWNTNKSRKNAELLLHANFVQGDYYATLTYNHEFLPKDLDQAAKDQRSMIGKLKRLYKNAGAELKYMWFTSYQIDKDGQYMKRIHHHLVINKLPKDSGFTRDDVENCWSVGGGKNAKSRGIVETKRIQGGSNGLKKIAIYLTGQEKWINRQWAKGKKRWSSSQNLKKPTETTNDSWWSQRKLSNVIKENNQGQDIFSSRFPGYYIIGEPQIREIEESGWHIYVEMLKVEP
ncbi:hypothetical protein GCM10011482_03720 [Enterococcus alcedinis]|uniref:Replication-associated protein ORF2/G2P domain-containing protein n=1 Tax=Enterococcus alcedinis TaxID=1274384 RepID=A0A917JCL8_9ENTE|nr:hypothetical protein GCM10011482_03720 [Enterococcus alcedinis]